MTRKILPAPLSDIVYDMLCRLDHLDAQQDGFADLKNKFDRSEESRERYDEEKKTGVVLL